MSSLSVRPTIDVRSTALWRGLVGILVAVVLWEILTQLDDWAGPAVPFVAALPAPTAVLADLAELVTSPGYWSSWSLSLQRVALGFGARSSSVAGWGC